MRLKKSLPFVAAILAVYVVSVVWEMRGHSESAFPPVRSVGGTIIFDVLETTDFGHEAYFVYRVRPDLGYITLARHASFKDTKDERLQPLEVPSGRIDYCYGSPRVASPDGQLAVHCEGDRFRGSGRHEADQIVVIDAKRKNEILRKAIPRDEWINGFVWSPDSQSVAVLTSSWRIGWGPLDLLTVLLMQPVPYQTFNLIIYRVNGDESRIPRVRTWSRYGWGRVLGWRS